MLEICPNESISKVEADRIAVRRYVKGGWDHRKGDWN